MSILSSRFDKRHSARKGSPIVGKLSIGIPTDEPMLVGPNLIGRKLYREIIFDEAKKTGLRKGKALSEADVQELEKRGFKEVHILNGSYPQRLEHFRLVRRAESMPGYLEDPELYEKFGLSDQPTEVPVMLTSEDIDSVLQTRLANFDRPNKCVYCSSDDGQTAMRRKKDSAGEYLESGEMFELECLPFYWDERVKSGGKKICEYRKYGSDGQAQACKFSGALYFVILSPDGHFDLGRYFKLETTSDKVAQYYINALLDPEKGVIRHFGRISFVPLKLEIIKEKAIRPEAGKKWGERKETTVIRTALSVDDAYLDKFKEPVEKIMERIESYRKMNQRLGIDETLPPKENVIADEYEVWSAEFHPQGRQELMQEEGIDVKNLEGDPEAEPVKVENKVSAETKSADRAAAAETSSESSGDGYVGEMPVTQAEEAYQLRLKNLEAKAMRLPAEKFNSYRGNTHKITPENIQQFEDYVDKLLAKVPEEEKADNFNKNAEAVEAEMSA